MQSVDLSFNLIALGCGKRFAEQMLPFGKRLVGTVQFLQRDRQILARGCEMNVLCEGFSKGSFGTIEIVEQKIGQAQTERGPIFFASDACWLSRAYREQRPPHPIADLIADDPRAIRKTLARLHDFAVARPDVAILPTRCAEALGRELRREAAALHAADSAT